MYIVLVALLLGSNPKGISLELVYRFGGLEQDRSLLKQRGTRSPSTKCPHEGTGNPERRVLS